MTATKTRAGILVRRVQFDYPADLEAHWNAARPEWSQVVNAASLLMPYLEPYLIEAIREGMTRINDPVLRGETKAYMGQEAHHYKQHRRFNDLLIIRSYDGIRAHERTLADDYACFTRERSLEFHLAYAAGFETMAFAIAHMLIRMRTWFFQFWAAETRGQISRAKGIKPIILTFMHDMEYRPRILLQYNNALLRGLASEEGILLIDVAEAFESVADKESYFFGDHYHPNQKGAEFIASTVANGWH